MKLEPVLRHETGQNREPMADPIVSVSRRLADAFSAVAGTSVDPVVRPSDRADAQANGALAIAKTLGVQPREVAQKALDAAGDLSDILLSTEIAGPGFINLVFSDDYLAQQLTLAMAENTLGVRVSDDPHTVVIDYSAPNVAKEMHVGHLRSTVIGDALVRVMGFVGHTVVRENHIGDWGTPFGMLIEHLIDLGEENAAHELGVGDLDGFYKQARAKFEASDEFKTRARHRVVMLQGGDDDTMRLWRTLVKESTRYFNKVYSQLDVLLTDDDLMGESAYNDLLSVVVDRLRDSGLLVESDGAEVVFPEGFTNRENEPLPLIIRKGDGGYNYATSDLGCVIDRVERIGARTVLYVVGAPQAQHLQMVEAVARMAKWMPEGYVMNHVSFGSVLGSDRKILKSRAGETVKLAALLDEAVVRAEAAVAEKNPDMSEAERSDVANMIGIGAVKYSDLSTDRVKDYIFDWERMLSFEGNTAPYLQYAHARICSIFRRAEVSRASVRGVTPSLAQPQERALALRLLRFDSAVWEMIDTLSPHKLCTYLFDLATDFTAFYEHCPVLKTGHEDTRESRLALCDATARVMEQGLALLGIRAPEQM
jgi:arginyl-tRNA synthetase